jgi:ABC-type transport system substrate-binding protein
MAGKATFSGTRRRLGRTALGGLGGLGLLDGARRVAAQGDVIAPELRLVPGEGFPSLDPVHAEEFVANKLGRVGAAEGLVRTGPTGEVEPELARSFEALDPQTWRFDLRPGVAFWSGRPLDAAAVVESLERSRALSPAAATKLHGLTVEAIDELTVVFHADRPVPALPAVFADYKDLAIHNARSYGPRLTYELAAADLTGFFKPVEYEPGGRAVFERNDRYWGVLPRMAQVDWEWVSDPDARTVAALSGEADIVHVSPAAVRQVERSRQLRLALLPSSSAVSVYFNPDRPPLDDVRVRQALAWGTDRDEFVTQTLDGYGEATASWLATSPAFPEARKVGYTRYDPARAAQLLDEAGWRPPPGGRVRQKDGAPLRFRLITFGAAGRSRGEVLQAQWQKVGVEVSLEQMEYSALVERRRQSANWDAFVEGAWPTGEMEATFRARLGPEGEFNYARFRDPTVDRLLAEFGDLLDPEARRQHALKLNERLTEVLPFLSIATSYRPVALDRRVRNYIEHPQVDAFEVHPDLWVAA